MGEVWTARDTRLDRIVAIKICKARFSQRFHREALAIASLNHPNICTLYDVGPNYLVMEYVEGERLKGPVPPKDALRHAEEIISALEAAHAKGIIHRDLKPGNILVTAGGIKLLDFGIAKVTRPSKKPGPRDVTLTQTRAGTILGTAAYMSPEQAEGQPVDARSDIFSVGTLLYELLTGARPFTGKSTLSTLVAVLHEEPPPFDAPGHLQRVVIRCLRKSPADRFQTMGEVRTALRQTASPAKEEPASIAVLPFADISRDQDNQYFGDGLAEEIINVLSQISGLRVIARTSAFAFKGKKEDVRSIAQSLGVASILEGSVRKAGNRVRIVVQLISATDGSQLWSERYDREMTDIFAVQDEIAQAVADTLRIKLQHSPERNIESRRPASSHAYEAYLEGRYHMHQMTPAGMSRARECFEKAIRLDARYALPHAALAECGYFQVMFMGAPPQEVVPGARAAADRALELDPESSDAHMIRGTIRAFYDYNWSEADEDFKRATNPGSVYVSARAVWSFAARNRLPEALAWIEQALKRDPINVSLRNSEVWVLGVMRAGDTAIVRSRALLALFHDLWSSRYMAALTLTVHGLHDEAAAALEDGLTHNPGVPLLIGCLAWVRGRQGRTGDAKRLRDQLEEMAGKQPVFLMARAFAAEGAGDVDREYQLLKESIDQREAVAPVFLMMRRPEFQSDPRYQELLRKINLA